jgi:hypothetical protein
MGADPLRFRQVDELLTSGQVAVIATAGSGLTGLTPARTLGLVVGRVLQFLGAVAGGLLLGAASKAFGLQLANFAAKRRAVYPPCRPAEIVFRPATGTADIPLLD